MRVWCVYQRASGGVYGPSAPAYGFKPTGFDLGVFRAREAGGVA